MRMAPIGSSSAKSRRCRSDSGCCRGELMVRGIEPISYAAYGADDDVAGIEFVAQPGYMHFDRVGGDVLVPSCQRLHDPVLADDVGRGKQQQFEDGPLAI